MDCEGPQQVWPLLHQPRTQDGRLWRVRQRASRPCDDFPPSEDLPRTNKLEVEDLADHRLQPSGECSLHTHYHWNRKGR